MNDHNRIFSGLLPQQNWDLASARKRGDWQHLQSLVRKGKDYIIQTVLDSGLRGRGGAGFLTGKKWTFMPSDPHPDRPHYLVVNADESEPGTCKDRLILLHEPHKILEGIVYACRAINAHTCFVYIRGEYDAEYKRLAQALKEARSVGLIGHDCGGSEWGVDIVLHRGAGAYICGEETALLESLEGGKGMPRIKPPFPAQSGLYGCPTTINNVESIAVIPMILRRGAHWFSSLGTEKSTGTRLFCISGDINKPCVIEEEMGISLKKLITEYADDVIGGWQNLLAIIPGGSSTKMLPRTLCQDISMDFETLHKVGSSLGTAGIIVINKNRDIIQAIERISAFYMHESCGQCTPCREGTGWLWRILSRIRKGQGEKDDIHQLQRIAKHVENSTICALGPAAAFPLQALIEHFSSTMEKRCLSKNERKIS